MNLFKSVSESELPIRQEAAYKFLYDSHQSYVCLYPNSLCMIMSEYLITMHRRFNMYKNRCKDVEKGDSDNDALETYIPEHLINLMRIIHHKELEYDVNCVKKFYEPILKLLDKAIGTRYCVGTKLTKKQFDKFDSLHDKQHLIACFPQNNITVFVPKKLFDLKEYLAKQSYSGEFTHEIFKKYYVLDFHDAKKNFYWFDLYDIKRACNDFVMYSLDPELITNKYINVMFDIA